MANWMVIYNNVKVLLDHVKIEEDNFNIDKEVKTNYPDFPVERVIELDIEKGYKEFKSWLNELFKEEPFSDSIIAFYFGLFESVDGVELYISGSNEWDEDDTDWACSNDYFPEGRYSGLRIYQDLCKLLKENDDVAFYLSLALPIVYSIRYSRENKDKLLSFREQNGRKECFYIATGFDDGDLFEICAVTDGGIKKTLDSEQKDLM